MSGEHVERVKERARAFLKEAERVEHSDLAMFFIEQALQLYIKAVYYELFGSKIRGHRLRELLGVLAKALESHGYSSSSVKLTDFVDRNRSVIIVAEDTYIMSRYGDISYTPREVGEALRVAGELLKLLDEVSKDVKLG